MVGRTVTEFTKAFQAQAIMTKFLMRNSGDKMQHKITALGLIGHRIEKAKRELNSIEKKVIKNLKRIDSLIKNEVQNEHGYN